MKKTVKKQEQTAVIYARARASSRDEEERAIQAQLRACRGWAEKNGYTVAKAYIDHGKGASRNGEEREGLKELLADTVNKQRAFNVILVQGFDRLFRDVLELENFRATLERKHLELICVSQPTVGYDTTEKLRSELSAAISRIEPGNLEQKNWRSEHECKTATDRGHVRPSPVKRFAAAVLNPRPHRSSFDFG